MLTAIKTPRRAMPNRTAIREFWWQKLTELGKFDGRFEMFAGDFCFSCGLEASLERAHILPHQTGGDEGPDNLHLLCSNCHKESENLCGDEYWEWFKKKRAFDCRMTNAARRAFREARLVEVQNAAMVATMEQERAAIFPAKLEDYAKRIIGIRMAQPYEDVVWLPLGFTRALGPFSDGWKFERTPTMLIVTRPHIWAQEFDAPLEAHLKCRPMETRKPSAKDIGIFGCRIREVITKWRLTELRIK